MQTFKQYLSEEDQNLASIATTINRWFKGYYMNAPLTSSDEDTMINAFREAIKLIPNPSRPPSNTLYRVFPDREFKTLLDAETNKKLDALKPGQFGAYEKIVNDALDGRNVSLNTGLKNIQSWSDSQDAAKRVYEEIEDHRVPYVLAQSSFSNSEILFYYKNINEFLKATFNNLGITSAIRNSLDNLSYIFAYQKEVVVDTRNPRPVKILSFFY